MSESTTQTSGESFAAIFDSSVKAIKECVKETLDLPVSEALAMKLPGLIAALESEDADEGPRAFQEKRKPVWKGR